MGSSRTRGLPVFERHRKGEKENENTGDGV